MSDTNERSVASAGSVCEPVAYQAVDEYGRPYGYAQIVLPFGKWPKSQRVPLYAQPQPTLTRGERQALEFAIGVYPLDDSIPDTLRALLERLG
jgi:hypothetical protein